MSPGTRQPNGTLVPDPPVPETAAGTEPPRRVTRADLEYEGLERDAIAVIREFLSTRSEDPSLLSRAKIAQGALGSVQSHKRTALGRRALDFDMVRSVTTDSVLLAEYIATSQPSAGLLKAVTAPTALGKPKSV